MIKLFVYFAVIFSLGSADASDRTIPFFEDKELTPYWKNEKGDSNTPAKIEKFNAVDQNAKQFTEQKIKGHFSLINFFFVQCPGICPLMMKNVQRLQSSLGDLESKVKVYSFSVQPNKDTPEKLRNYAEIYKINLQNWTLLTGEKKEIYRVGKDMFKADGAVGRQKSDDSFIHTQNIYLVDENLYIRGIYNTSDINDMKQLKEDISILNKDISRKIVRN